MIREEIDTATEDPALYGRYSDGTSEVLIPTLPGRWRNYYENIRDVLTTGATPQVQLDDVRRAIAVLDAAFTSARERRTVIL